MSNSLSEGYKLSITLGQYEALTLGYLIPRMQTVFETRRARLAILVKRYGSVAKLNKELGWEVTNARLYQIHNKSIRSDRGTLFEMGDPTAREIETKLSLDLGWMDTPPSPTEVFGEEDLRAKVLAVMEHMPEYQWPKVLQMLDIFAQPESKNGTDK